ncbi:MAG: nicotinate phosphoribosyltransferase [Acidimicrobiia bacterium]
MPISRGALLTDHYQLMMAQLYFRNGLHEREARFEHFFRGYPDYGEHQAGYAINAGWGWLGRWADRSRFGSDETSALRAHVVGGHRLFDDDFLTWLGEVTWDSLRYQVIPEGRVCHPNIPLTVVEGPLAVAQLIETPLLNHLNFHTLIATKASRVVEVARGGSVLEFGLRRAPDEGGIAATRAALIGGADASSNVGISHEMGILPQGTHAHSMVQVFMALGEGELEAFRAYAAMYPDQCVLLVDTVDTLESGVPNAIKVFEELRRSGHRPVGIRLDSGDLAHLAVRSAILLDKAGFDEVKIVLSSGLDELTISQILTQIEVEAPRYGADADEIVNRLTYGVGTKMATSHGRPYLDGVFKLVAVSDETGWRPAIKVSDTGAKVVNPGRKKVHRLYDMRGMATVDVMALADEELTFPLELHHHRETGIGRVVPGDRVSSTEELLVAASLEAPADDPAIVAEARKRRIADLERLDPGVKRLVNPHVYHVSVTRRLAELKARLIEESR